MNEFHVLTGAPGTGKSTVLERCSDSIAVVREPARRVLVEWRAEGNPLPAKLDPNLMLARLVETTVADHAAVSGVVLFDRGAIDSVVYARYLGVDDSAAMSAARSLRFDGCTFLLAPWEEIYTTDEERTMTFAVVERFHDVLVDTYREFGVGLIEVPRGSVGERASFVLDWIS